MTVFTFHLAKSPFGTTVRALAACAKRATSSGLNYAERMTRMTLGAPILSPARMQHRHLTMFAAWDEARPRSMGLLPIRHWAARWPPDGRRPDGVRAAVGVAVSEFDKFAEGRMKSKILRHLWSR